MEGKNKSTRPKVKIPAKNKDPTPEPSPKPIIKPDANPKRTLQFVEEHWKSWFIKGLKDYIRVENRTPKDDPDYCANHFIDQAIECIDIYAEKLEITRLTRKIQWVKGDEKISGHKHHFPPCVVY